MFPLHLILVVQHRRRISRPCGTSLLLHTGQAMDRGTRGHQCARAAGWYLSWIYQTKTACYLVPDAELPRLSDGHFTISCTANLPSNSGPLWAAEVIKCFPPLRNSTLLGSCPLFNRQPLLLDSHSSFQGALEEVGSYLQIRGGDISRWVQLALQKQNNSSPPSET